MSANSGSGGALPAALPCPDAELPPGANRALSWLWLPSEAPMVKATGFLPWVSTTTAGVARALIPRAFYSAAVWTAAQKPTDPAEISRLHAINPLTFRPTLAALQRLVAVQNAHAVLSTPSPSLSSFISRHRTLQLSAAELATCQVKAADFEEGDSFNGSASQPRAAPAARGRSRSSSANSGAPAAAAPVAPPQPGPTDQRWLTLLDGMMDDAAMARLWMLFPDSLSRDARQEEGSHTSLANESLRAAVLSRLSHVNQPSDMALAREFTRVANEMLFYPLPALGSEQLTVETVLSELQDTTSFHKGSMDADRSVARRLHLGHASFPELSDLAVDLPFVGSRMEAVQRLVVATKPSLASSALALQLRDASKLLQSRSPLITAGRAKGKTGMDLVDLVLTDVQSVGTSAITSASDSGDTHASSSSTSVRLSNEALHRAVNTQAFQQLAAQLDALNTDTASGRRSAHAAASLAGCPIIQQFYWKPGSLKGRNPVFTKLHACLGEYGSYIGRSQAMDDVTGQVAAEHVDFQPSSEQLTSLRNGKISLMQWVNAPNGALTLLNLQSAETYANVPESQLYTVKSCLEVMGPFAHKTMVAWGAPAISTTGYTMATLCAKHAQHLDKVAGMSEVMQAELIPFARSSFAAALAQMDLNLQLFLESPEPASATLPHLLGFGEVYDRTWEAKMDALRPVVTIQRALPGLLPASTSRSLPGVVGATDPNRPGTGKGKVTQLDGGRERPKAGTAPTVKWLKNGKSMRIGGDLFDVEAISKQLGLDQAASKALCWPVILSRKKGDRALVNCPCPKKAGHSSMTDTAHARPSGFNLDEICKDKKLRTSEPQQKGKGKRKRGQ